MGVLQDFERRLEGAVEGFFARAFRSGLHPIELAKALQRYAEDNQHVTGPAIVVPNHYRLRLHPDDLERLGSYGGLQQELGNVVLGTTAERGWTLRGGAHIELEADEAVAFGRYELTGRVDPDIPVASRAEVPVSPLEPAVDATITIPSTGATLTLTGGRATVGRLPSCEVLLDDPTVSREHAAFVRRGQSWWVLDLGSTNGTRVNGVDAAEHPLSDGDEIEFGEVTVLYRTGT